MSQTQRPSRPSARPPEQPREIVETDAGPVGAASLRIALAGNPNSGTTTLFNALTGSRQHVGNYAGVTVDKISGTARHRGCEVEVVDLPGTYSLTAYSAEEIVARNHIIEDVPDVVVDVVDASNLERNLYLATQLLELGVPLVLAFNMIDVAEARGWVIEIARLSALLGVPIVPTVAHKGQGLDRLMETVAATARLKDDALAQQRRCDYGRDIEPHLAQLEAMLAQAGDRQHARWFAVKLLEGDAETTRRLRSRLGDRLDPLLTEAEAARRKLQSLFGDSPEVILADRKYGFISGACTEAVTQSVEARHERSDRIDAVLTHRIWGLPIFALLMYLTFQLTFTLGQYPMDWLESGFEWLGLRVAMFWPRGSDSVLKSLLVDGVIGGVGGVLVFLPNILLLFLAIALLEGTGYMARAAFLMDAVMHRIGLHGKSFIPMLVGFGCSVPAILATRTLETRRDRLTTMMIVPLMSCGARLPIYALIIPAFFPLAWRGPMLWLIYFIGILLAVVCAKLLRRTVLAGESTPFVMELPPYRMPTARALVSHMWERGWMYVRKAGTMILAAAVLLWAATAFPRLDAGRQEALEQMQQVRAEAVANLDAIAEAAEVEPALLRQAAQARLELEIDQQRYWPDQPGYAEALRRYEDRVAAIAPGPQGNLAALMDEVDAIDALRTQFDDEVEQRQLEDGSLTYNHLLHQQEELLELRRRRQPRIHAAALAWLDDYRAPLEERLQQIENDLRARQLSHSVAGRVGKGMEPALKLMGFDWRIGTALVGAFAAKEIFVSQMGIVYATGEADDQSESLRSQLKTHYTPLTGFCVMLFCLVATPCIGTVAVVWKESGSWKWAALQWVGLTVLAFILTTMVYQVGRLVA